MFFVALLASAILIQWLYILRVNIIKFTSDELEFKKKE
jgi:hypothetical protein